MRVVIRGHVATSSSSSIAVVVRKGRPGHAAHPLEVVVGRRAVVVGGGGVEVGVGEVDPLSAVVPAQSGSAVNGVRGVQGVVGVAAGVVQLVPLMLVVLVVVEVAGGGGGRDQAGLAARTHVSLVRSNLKRTRN